MKELKIYYTSDVHGAIFPEEGGSLLQCIEDFQVDGNTLVLDGGDSIQGSPLVKYLHQSEQLSALARAFHMGRYDYYTLGNHDFNYGHQGIKSFVEEMTATCVAANVIDSTGKLPIVPYEIRTMANGMKIGITGIVTDFVNLWESQDRLHPLLVGGAFMAAKKVFQKIQDRCDFTICIYHGGFELDLDTGAELSGTGENIACKLCRELDYDLLLTAHQHKEVEGRYYHGTYVLQVPAKGQGYGVVKVSQEAPITVIHSHIHRHSPSVSEELYEKILPVRDQAEEWLQTQIRFLEEEERTGDRVQQGLEGSIFADLGNFVQLLSTGAEVSCFSLPNREISFPKKLTVGAVLDAYPYANKVVVVEMLGEALRRGLERSASYFRWTPQGNTVDSRFLQPKEIHYHYDFFANVSFTLQLSAFGENVVTDVKVCGRDLEDGRLYRVAMSEYRAAGVGGYDFYKDAPVVKMVDKDIQDLMLDFLQEKPLSCVPRFQQIHLKTE